MADDTDDSPKTDTPAVTPRRRAPRKTTTTRATAAKAPAKPRRPRAKPEAPSTVAKVEEAVSDAAAATTRRAKAVAGKAESAVAAAAKSVKPRSTKRSTPRAGAKKAGKPAAKKSGETNKWGIAAIGAGVATVGAVAAAALLSLRGSTPKSAKAHSPAGEDASGSFEAGIADENTIPDKL
ncbi:hypothetical protein [Sphingomonas sp. CV7422]|uniref:hypothetical protein n=1 Tax=Sphingomonas sp. CV7422 TaxID=3018036 RepID=UPI0022FDBC8E|nr:hypothetical protein [Sphingomonas sp. CV7422]